MLSDTESRRRDQGCFTLLMESTKLLGQVLMHSSSTCLKNDNEEPDNLWEKALQLDRTLKSLVFAAETEARKFDVDIEGQLNICYR